MKKILIIIFSVIGLVVIVGLFLSRDFRVERSIEIKASGEAIYKMIGDLKSWPVWAPWSDEDPTMKTTLGDKTTGVGASQSWVGDEGDGRLVVKKADPNFGLEYDLYFENDKYHSVAGMNYTDGSKPETKKVAWYMKGNMDAPIIGGYFALMMNSAIGSMFDNGLQKLKSHLERP